MSIEDVGFEIDRKVLLQPLNLHLRAGEIVALIGHNGSGKSTLLKLMARQEVPSRGRIIFDGKPLSNWGGRALARRLAYLPQRPPAAPGMTARELVSMGRFPWHGALGRFSVQDREVVEEALSMTSTKAFEDQVVDTLSGGERQRIWLAMMLAQSPVCLLLDEPTSALDIGHQLEVLGLVGDLCERKKISAVVVMHDVNMAARFCHRIVALRSGQLVADGSPEEIMTAEAMKRILDVDMDIIRQSGSDRLAALPR